MNEKLNIIYDIETYNYELPKDLIAQEPSKKRDESRLMIVTKDKIEHKQFHNILEYINKGDVIVINKTKVLKFKLYAQKESGANVEITILNENITNYDKDQTKFKCKIKAKKPKVGTKFIFDDEHYALITNEENENFILEFYTKDIIMNFDKLYDFCDKRGFYPLPHYIKEQKKDEIYQERYQSVFAKEKGSIAAPTASLHFTDELINKLKEKGVIFAELILHVSYSTFKSIKENDIRKHVLDPEFIEIDSANAKIINNAKSNVIAVGTTVLKSLESLSDENGLIKEQKINSKLFIYPSYIFKSKANKLITNFHLPKSSLILLTSAFASWKLIKESYEEAVKQKYRFFSFGDAMMVDKFY